MSSNKIPSVSPELDHLFFTEMEIIKTQCQLNAINDQRQQLQRKERIFLAYKKDCEAIQQSLAFELMNSMSHRKFCRLMGISGRL